MSLIVQSDPSVEGLWRIALQPDLPGPRVAVVGGMHGNEPCGVRAVERLLESAREGSLPLMRGTLILLHGNPLATAQGLRCTPGGTDLNRLFDFQFERTLDRSAWCAEHHRAHALRPVLDEVDALVDLHSSTRPTAPFAIATESPASAALASQLGLPYVVRGWSGPGMLGDRVMLAPLDKRGVGAVAVECGQHEEPEAVTRAEHTARQFLQSQGLLAPSGKPEKARWLRLHDAVRRPSSSFRFSRPLDGFETLQPGEEIGRDGLLVLTAQGACVTVMPNDSVPAGEDMLYLAIDEPVPPGG